MKQLHLALLCAAAVTLSACSPPPPPPAASSEAAAALSASPTPPPTVAKANSSIKGVKLTGKTLTVTAYQDFAFDEEGFFNDAAVISDDVGKALKAGAHDAAGAKIVTIVFQTDLQDRLGNAKAGTFATISFDADDMKAANYQNLGLPDFMNLATDVEIEPAGVQGAMKWCKSNVERASGFCAKAL